MANIELSIKAEFSSLGEISAVVTRCQQGDQEAFRYLFYRYSRPVIDFIYSMLGDPTLAEELMQDTFVRAYRNLKGLRETTKFSTWLFGIAKNVVKEAIKEKYQQKLKVALDEPLSLLLVDEKQTPDQQILHTELHTALRKVLLELNEDWRTVFILKLINQQSYEEIAEITGWSIGKIKTDLHRARLEIKRKMGSYLC